MIEESVRIYLHNVFREIEDAYREKNEIPKIGEGWISESELYKKIRKVFPKENIVHHGRPEWLGKQHLDIFFPDRNIAIEYQGLQHDTPVEFFGGVKGYQENKRRDLLKNEKCKDNDCILIYVYPDYNFDEVIEKIKNILNQQK